ncbi:MAG: hypothetical protein K2N35_12750 [Muribaculaceae bacterium]|nr:hypothetical protein [Muribaculaceae bacterium]
MAITQMKRALWMLSELIESSPRGLTREELDRKWAVSTFNDKGEKKINKRTFYRLRDDLQEIFQIDIICSKDGNNRYYIEQTEYSVFLGMLCQLVTDNSKRNLSLKDLMLQVLNGVEITEDEKCMLDDISFKISKEAYECGKWLIKEAEEGRIKGADKGQWSEHRKYHLCIWLEEEYQRLKSWVGVNLNRKAADGRGEIRFYIVCESQDETLHTRLMKELSLFHGEKREGDYWWFAPKDDALHVMSYVSMPDRNAIRTRVETLLSCLNQFTTSF